MRRSDANIYAAYKAANKACLGAHLSHVLASNECGHPKYRGIRPCALAQCHQCAKSKRQRSSTGNLTPGGSALACDANRDHSNYPRSQKYT